MPKTPLSPPRKRGSITTALSLRKACFPLCRLMSSGAYGSRPSPGRQCGERRELIIVFDRPTVGRRTSASPRRIASGLCCVIAPSTHREGAGKVGHRLIPAAPVREEVHGAGTTGSAGQRRPSLREWVTAYTRSPRGPAFLPPSSARSSSDADLAPAPGRQDHAISPSVTRRSSVN